MNNKELPFCECGQCNERVTKKGNRFINGHQNRGRKHLQKTKDKQSKRKLGKNNPMYGKTDKDNLRYGKKHTPESITIMSEVKIQYYIDHPDEAEKMSKRMIQYNIDHPETKEATRLKLIEYWAIQANRDADSERLKNSEKAKVSWENMRGGNDICDHHYIYDHDDLSKYTMKMTRSEHQRLHKLMIKAGIKVPHINVKEE